MALRFLLDEQLRGPLWGAIQHHNAAGVYPLDALRVGNAPGPPAGTKDPDLLMWCESYERVLVTEDRNSMPGHIVQHLAAGHHTAGALILRDGWTIRDVVEMLVLYDQTHDPADMVDLIAYIP
jgi:hypothetical protein